MAKNRLLLCSSRVADSDYLVHIPEGTALKYQAEQLSYLGQPNGALFYADKNNSTSNLKQLLG